MTNIMSEPDFFSSTAEAMIYDLRKMLEMIIIAHETGRNEPLQAAVEAAIARLAEMGMPSPIRALNKETTNDQ